MVGNDLVDLQEAKRTTNWERPRWLQKVFTPKEQAIIKTSSDPFTVVWKLWSIKESAYKVFLQAGGAPFLDPTKIECHCQQAENSEVKVGALLLKARTIITPSYLFSTAQLHDSTIKTGLLLLGKRSLPQQSSFLKQQLLEEVATTNGLAMATLHLQKTDAGIPRLYYEGQRLPIACSMTHHGKYGAYSILSA